MSKKKLPYITFKQDTIKLNDTMNPWLSFAASCVLIVSILIQAWFRFDKKGADVLVYLLGTLGVLLLSLVVYSLLKNSFKTLFTKTEILEVQVRKRFNGKVMLLKLNNGKQKALQLRTQEDIEAAIKTFKQEGISVNEI